MNKDSRVYVSGHTGLVGSAIVRLLRTLGYTQIITATHTELELMDAEQVEYFFTSWQPEYVFFCSAHVGGIMANKNNPVDFIVNNLKMEINVIENCYKSNVKKLLFFGSSCIYPSNCPQPIKEEYFLTGELESTNDAYAIAKIAGIKMIQAYNRQYKTNFVSVMPTNIFGINDNFNLETSHLIPALISKIHSAKRNNEPSVQLWGSGKPYREILSSDNLADASLFIMNYDSDEDIYNIGSGEEKTILDWAKEIADVIGYKSGFILDDSKPDGTYRKFLDCSKLAELGWTPKTTVREDLQNTYEWYKGKINE